MNSNLCMNCLLIRIGSLDATNIEKVLSEFCTIFAKVAKVFVLIIVKVPVKLFGQKLGVTVQAGRVHVDLSPKK